MYGFAANGTRLRCSAGTAVAWLRDDRAIAGARARTYVVRVRDEGHALACRARLDGAPATSAAVRIPKPHGGRSRDHALTSTSAALWPPKPKLFESDARTSTPCRALPIT